MYADEQARLFRDGVRGFCAEHASADKVEHWHRNKHIPADELFPLMAQAAITTISIPEELGGPGGRLLDKYVISRELARVDPALQLETAGHGLFRDHFLLVAKDQQKERVLPDLLAGARGAWALTGPDSGSTPYTSGTNAKKVDGGWRLNGNRDFITGAKSAQWLIINANSGEKKMTAFLVKQGSEGLSFSRPYDKVSMPGTETVSVHCDDLFIPDENVLGNVDDALNDILANLTAGRLYITAGALGIIDRVLTELDTWMAERKSGGRTLEQLTTLQEKRSKMFIAQTAANAMIKQIADLDPRDRHTQALATAAKIYTTEQATLAALDGAIIHGGSGVVREHCVARLWVDSMVYIVGEGANPTLNYQLGRHLTKHPQQ